MSKETRLRVWAGIFYPESTREDWQRILNDNCVCCAVSPIHDRDVVIDTGELKKPHYHIVLRFSGPKSFNQVWDILKLISKDGSCPPPEVPHSDVNRLVQYLVHANDPEKFQYLRSDILSFNGFDVASCFRLTMDQEDQLFNDLLDFIITQNIREYWDLIIALRSFSVSDNLYDEMLRFARNHTILFTNLLKSRRFSS